MAHGKGKTRSLNSERFAIYHFPFAIAALRSLRIPLRSTLATWGILALESCVAMLMLMPTRRALQWPRHAALLVFCVVTYAFAPVAGFGWLLLVMGMAQLEPRELWWGRAYLTAFLVVLFYDEIPLVELALDLVR